MTNNGYKLLVIDIDGTLLNSRGIISAEDKAALNRVIQAGIRVCLSTGRALQASLKVLNELSLDNCHIFFDGALISSPSRSLEIHIRLIEKALVQQMVEFAHRHEIDLELYSPTKYFAERETWSTEAHHHFFDSPPNISPFDGIWEQEKIIKAGIAATKPEEAEKAAAFRREFSGRLSFSQAITPSYPGVVFNNVLAPDVSKGTALKALTDYLGLSLRQAAAVGDGTNDIPLLQTAGLGIAMGNATTEVKQAADQVTLDVDHSGLAAAIERFLLA